MPRWTWVVVLGLTMVVTACHRHGDFEPLTTQTIYFSDKFFDVKALGPERALIAGYGGKLLETTDGGLTFTRLPTGTDMALYDVAAVGDELWIVGQEGLIIHSADGGKSWTEQKSNTEFYLFAVTFLDESHGFAVGDRSVLVETKDGGENWSVRKIQRSFDADNPDLALAMQDPIFYDIRFANDQVGWISGEFGRLLKTEDGGQTWIEQQETLMGEETGIVDPMDIPTFFGVTPLSEVEAYAAGIDGKIAYTDDGGELWTFQPMSLEFPIVDPLYKAIVTPGGKGWAIGAAGEILIREPADSTSATPEEEQQAAEQPARPWKRANLGMSIYTWLRSIDFPDAKNGWMVGGYGTILRTEDGGETWRQCFG